MMDYWDGGGLLLRRQAVGFGLLLRRDHCLFGDAQKTLVMPELYCTSWVSVCVWVCVRIAKLRAVKTDRNMLLLHMDVATSSSYHALAVCRWDRQGQVVLGDCHVWRLNGWSAGSFPPTDSVPASHDVGF